MSTPSPDSNVRGGCDVGAIGHPDSIAPDEETALLGSRSPDGSSSSVTQVVAEEEAQESWNEPRINTYRFAACNLTFLILGMHDACLGVSFPFHPTYRHYSTHY